MKTTLVYGVACLLAIALGAVCSPGIDAVGSLGLAIALGIAIVCDS